MNSPSVSFLAIILALATLSGHLRAQDADATTETRLRDALRNTTYQLRDAQSQLVTLQADNDQAKKDNTDLTVKVANLSAQVASLTQQSSDDKATADKSIADLNAQVTDLTSQVSRLNQDLTAWKSAYDQMKQVAADKEAARAKLAMEAALLQRTVDDREAKNLELYKTGMEILTRYEQFSLGDALAAKEPFAGLSRVKLENLVQDYKGKLLNQTVISGQPPASPSSTPAPRTGQESPPSENPPAKT